MIFFWQIFDRDRDFIQAERNAAIHLNNSFVGYPIENHLYQLPASTAKNILNDIVNLSREDPKETTNFDKFLLSLFGPTLCELYFFPYNSKIWQADLSNLSVEWLGGKLPMPKPIDILTANIVRAKESDMVHSTFFYQRTGGSQFIVDKLLYDANIRHSPVNRIEVSENSPLKIGDQEYDHLFYTGNIKKLPSIVNMPNSLSLDLSKLAYHGTSTLLCHCIENPYSWVYIPTPSIPVHRVIMTGNFSRNNSSRNLEKGRISCTVEASGMYSAEDMSAMLPMLPFGLQPIAWNHEEFSYIMQTHKTRSIIKSVEEYFGKFNISFVGRFAEWVYYNMDAAIASAMGKVQKLKASFQ